MTECRNLPNYLIIKFRCFVMDSSEVARIVGSGMTVSDKIRALDVAGCSRAEIARLLGKRYQHVRNVLEADKVRGGGAPLTGVSEEGAAFTRAGMDEAVERRGPGLFRLAVGRDGTVVLPREVCEAFGLAGGGGVIARLEGDELRLISPTASLRRAQEVLKPYMREGVSWADQLIAERRREVEREDKGG